MCFRVGFVVSQIPSGLFSLQVFGWDTSAKNNRSVFSAWDSSRGNVRKVVCELWIANLRFQIISWSYRIGPSFGNFRMERAFKNLRLSALFCPF